MFRCSDVPDDRESAVWISRLTDLISIASSDNHRKMADECLQIALQRLAQSEKFPQYSLYLQEEWIQSKEDLKTAVQDEITWNHLKLPARLKIELKKIVLEDEGTTISPKSRSNGASRPSESQAKNPTSPRLQDELHLMLHESSAKDDRENTSNKSSSQLPKYELNLDEFDSALSPASHSSQRKEDFASESKEFIDLKEEPPLTNRSQQSKELKGRRLFAESEADNPRPLQAEVKTSQNPFNQSKETYEETADYDYSNPAPSQENEEYKEAGEEEEGEGEWQLGYSEEYQCYYYYNLSTGESQWAVDETADATGEGEEGYYDYSNYHDANNNDNNNADGYQYEGETEEYPSYSYYYNEEGEGGGGYYPAEEGDYVDGYDANYWYSANQSEYPVTEESPATGVNDAKSSAEQALFSPSPRRTPRRKSQSTNHPLPPSSIDRQFSKPRNPSLPLKPSSFPNLTASPASLRQSQERSPAGDTKKQKESQKNYRYRQESEDTSPRETETKALVHKLYLPSSDSDSQQQERKKPERASSSTAIDRTPVTHNYDGTGSSGYRNNKNNNNSESRNRPSTALPNRSMMTDKSSPYYGLEDFKGLEEDHDNGENEDDNEEEVASSIDSNHSEYYIITEAKAADFDPDEEDYDEGDGSTRYMVEKYKVPKSSSRPKKSQDTPNTNKRKEKKREEELFVEGVDYSHLDDTNYYYNASAPVASPASRVLQPQMKNQQQQQQRSSRKPEGEDRRLEIHTSQLNSPSSPITTPALTSDYTTATTRTTAAKTAALSDQKNKKTGHRHVYDYHGRDEKLSPLTSPQLLQENGLKTPVRHSNSITSPPLSSAPTQRRQYQRFPVEGQSSSSPPAVDARPISVSFTSPVVGEATPGASDRGGRGQRRGAEEEENTSEAFLLMALGSPPPVTAVNATVTATATAVPSNRKKSPRQPNHPPPNTTSATTNSHPPPSLNSERFPLRQKGSSAVQPDLVIEGGDLTRAIRKKKKHGLFHFNLFGKGTSHRLNDPHSSHLPTPTTATATATATDATAAMAVATTVPPSHLPPKAVKRWENIKTLKELGYAEKTAIFALEVTGDDLNEAIIMLTEAMGDVPASFEEEGRVSEEGRDLHHLHQLYPPRAAKPKKDTSLDYLNDIDRTRYYHPSSRSATKAPSNSIRNNGTNSTNLSAAAKGPPSSPPSYKRFGTSELEDSFYAFESEEPEPKPTVTMHSASQGKSKHSRRGEEVLL